MNYYEIQKDGEIFGTIATQLNAEEIETLIKKYFDDETYEDMIDDFVDYLILNNHDMEARRFFIDETIIL